MDLYKYLLIAALVAAIVGGIYYAGGVTPRRELVQFKAEAAAKTAAVEAKMAADKEASDQFIAKKDYDHETAIAAIRADWMLDRAGRNATKPVPIATGLCENQAGNAAVSDAVQEYVSAVGRFRAGVAGLLEQADINGAALQCAHDWAEGEQLIHH